MTTKAIQNAGAVVKDTSSTVADWVVTRAWKSDDADKAPSYWAGSQMWLAIEADGLFGTIRTFASAAAAKDGYRAGWRSFPRTYSVVQLTAEQVAAIAAGGDELEGTGDDELEDTAAEPLEEELGAGHGDTSTAAIAAQEATEGVAPGAAVPAVHGEVGEVVSSAAELDAGELDTVVDDEIVEALNKDAAQDLDGRIRTMAAQVHDDIATLEQLVIEARAGQIHQALGFASWPAYLADALRDTVHVDRAGRRELVGFLAGQDLANRAIAAIADVDEGTVRGDLKALRKNSAVDPAPARKKTGLDGKTRRQPTKTAAKKPTTKPAATAPPPAEGEELVTEAPIDSAATEAVMENFVIVINSDGTAAVDVTFMGDGEPCVIPLGGKLNKRITPAVAADLGYHLGRASTKILVLLEQLDRRAGKAGS